MCRYSDKYVPLFRQKYTAITTNMSRYSDRFRSRFEDFFGFKISIPPSEKSPAKIILKQIKSRVIILVYVRIFFLSALVYMINIEYLKVNSEL